MAECKNAATPLSSYSINTNTILLSKSDFLFALLLVTFELLKLEQSYIPLLKALMCGINAVGAQGSGCMLL